MAKRTLKNNQTLIDSTLLTYGRIDAYFQVIQDNESGLIEDGIVEVDPNLEPGGEIYFDDTNTLYDAQIAEFIAREPAEIATKTASSIQVVELLKPIGVVVAYINESEIQVDWSDNNEFELGYEIQRSEDGVSGWQTLEITEKDVEQYIDQI